MDVKVVFRFFVDIYFELGDFVFRFGDYDEIVRRENFELFSLVVIFLRLR